MHSGPIRVLACSDAPNRIVVAHRRNCTSTPIPCSPFADDARAQTHLAETSAALVFPFRPSFHNPCFFIRAWLLAYHPDSRSPPHSIDDHVDVPTRDPLPGV